MKWIYWAKLYDTKFQASCLAKRIAEDWWIYGYAGPDEVEIFQVKKGKYGVRFSWTSPRVPDLLPKKKRAREKNQN
ncbi:hypothetical protein BSNK01_13230 [Bacillaceae bacterium]